MYSKEFWNNIYINSYSDVPWMDDTGKTSVFNLVEEIITPLLNHNNEDFTLLDYGCGNGHMGLLFSRKGVKVDLADISDVLVEKLKKEYCNEANVNVFNTTRPDELPKGKIYNVIIARNVFHHLDPEVWFLFLKEFCERLKPEGLLMISGWDKEDEVIKQENNIARYTEHKTWCINDLPNYVNNLALKIDRNQMLEIKAPLFNTKRKFRFFVLNKIKQNT